MSSTIPHEFDINENLILTNEDRVLSSLNALKFLYQSKDPNSTLSSLLSPVIPNIYMMLEFATKHHLTIRTILNEIMASYLETAEHLDIINFLNFICLELPEIVLSQVPSIGPSRQLMIIKSLSNINIQTTIDTMAPYLKLIDKEVIGDFFLLLLEHYASLNQTTLSAHHTLFIASLTVRIMEDFGTAILSKSGTIITFTKTIITSFGDSNEEIGCNEEEGMTPLQLALLLLESIVKQGNILID